MTLTIELPSDLADVVRERAARRGQDMNAFIVQALQDFFAKPRNFEEVCQPIANAVTATGMTDRELDDFFEEARNEAWKERQAKRGLSADEVIAKLAMPQPVPDDAQCQQLLEDELLKKYGR